MLSEVTTAGHRRWRSFTSTLFQPYLLADVAVGRDNNFNLLRFLAATLVIFSHCFALSHIQAPEPIWTYGGGLEVGGSIGVLIFFIISGYLVTQSFVSRGDRLASFFAARALRIYPGLIAAVIFSVLLAGVTSNLSWQAFLTHPDTRRYLLQNSLGWTMNHFLPGAYPHNQSPGAANGSLWTLPLEIRLYITLAVFGVLGLFSSRVFFNAVCLVLLATGVTANWQAWLPWQVDTPRLAMAFLFGAFFFINRHHVQINLGWAVLGVLLILVGAKFMVPSLLRNYYVPVIGYLLLVVAYHPKLHVALFHRFGDYSYGLYVFAFPIQQLAANYYPVITPFRLFLVCFPLVLAMAMLSWRFIEKPALAWKPK
jgi:peptidoglycan/LPS O-acetylase OafA/YrhL